MIGSAADLSLPLSQHDTSFNESMLHPDNLAVCKRDEDGKKRNTPLGGSVC